VLQHFRQSLASVVAHACIELKLSPIAASVNQRRFFMSDKAKTKSLEIEPIVYEGSVDDFRAWMDGFLSRASVVTLLDAASQEEIRQKAFDEWKNRGMKGDVINFSQYYPRLIVQYSELDKSTNREVWYVTRYDPMKEGRTKPSERWATILAIQAFNTTTIQFLDGFYFRFRKSDGRVIDNARADFIGDDFSMYAKFIKDEWKKRDRNLPDETITESVLKSREVRKIPSVQYSGSVAHFRAWMDRFLAVNGKVFEIEKEGHTLEYHIGYFTPARTQTREVWNVYINPGIVINGKRPGDSHFAMILAAEEHPDQTTIEFIDGQCYERVGYSTKRSLSEPPTLGEAHLASHEPIGDDFLLIAERIKAGLTVGTEAHQNAFPEEPKTNNLWDWFDYLHAVKHRMRIKLEYIAGKTGYATSTVKKEHSLYLKEKGIQKVTKSNRK
jgi:hypothetical protein